MAGVTGRLAESSHLFIPAFVPASYEDTGYEPNQSRRRVSLEAIAEPNSSIREVDDASARSAERNGVDLQILPGNHGRVRPFGSAKDSDSGSVSISRSVRTRIARRVPLE